MYNWKNVQYANSSGILNAMNDSDKLANAGRQQILDSITGFGDDYSKLQTDKATAAIMGANTQEEAKALYTDYSTQGNGFINNDTLGQSFKEQNQTFRDIATHEDLLASNLQAREQTTQAMQIAEEQRAISLEQLNLDAEATKQTTVNAKQSNSIRAEQRPYLLDKLKLDNKATDQKVLTAMQTYNYNNKKNPLELAKFLVNIDHDKLNLSRDEIKKTAEVAQVNRENFVNASLSGLTENNNYQNADILKQLTQGAVATGVKDKAFYNQLNAYKLDHLRTTSPKFDLGSENITEQDLMEGVRLINEAAASFPGADTEARKMFVNQLMEDSGLKSIKSRLDAVKTFDKYKKEKAVDTFAEIEVKKAENRAKNGVSNWGSSNKQWDKSKTIDFFTKNYATVSNEWSPNASPITKFFEVLDRNLFAVRAGHVEETVKDGVTTPGDTQYTVAERNRAYYILANIVRFDEAGADEFHLGDQSGDSGNTLVPGGEGSISDVARSDWEDILRANGFKRDSEVNKASTGSLQNYYKRFNSN